MIVRRSFQGYSSLNPQPHAAHICTNHFFFLKKSWCNKWPVFTVHRMAIHTFTWTHFLMDGNVPLCGIGKMLEKIHYRWWKAKEYDVLCVLFSSVLFPSDISLLVCWYLLKETVLRQTSCTTGLKHPRHLYLFKFALPLSICLLICLFSPSLLLFILW